MRGVRAEGRDGRRVGGVECTMAGRTCSSLMSWVSWRMQSAGYCVGRSRGKGGGVGWRERRERAVEKACKRGMVSGFQVQKTCRVCGWEVERRAVGELVGAGDGV